MLQRTSFLRVALPVGFFSGLVAMLFISDTFGPTTATTVVVNGDKPIIQQVPEPKQKLPRCKEDNDCPLPTTYCGPSGKCMELKNPTCDCSQPQVMRCFEESGKARFLYCPVACMETGNGAICQ